jgi:hypothetical protein
LLFAEYPLAQEETDAGIHDLYPRAKSAKKERRTEAPALTCYGECLPFALPFCEQRKDPLLMAQQPKQRSNSSWQSRQNPSGFQSNSSSYRRTRLVEERLRLQREMERTNVKLEALAARWNLWKQRRVALDGRRPLALAQTAASLLGVRYLPPIARQWEYESLRLNQERQWLENQGIAIHFTLDAFAREMNLIETEIAMVDFS